MVAAVVVLSFHVITRVVCVRACVCVFSLYFLHKMFLRLTQLKLRYLDLKDGEQCLRRATSGQTPAEAHRDITCKPFDTLRPRERKNDRTI